MAVLTKIKEDIDILKKLEQAFLIIEVELSFFFFPLESGHLGPRSCDFWCWKDREDIDPRSKYVIPKLIEKLGELENLVESCHYIDNHASINEVEKFELNKFVKEASYEVDKPKESKDDNCVDMKLEKLEEDVEKIKEKEKK
ncbi:hypothetical protein T459_12811 [Capsicum annuum]|uniref:Uncharacterized protein n=1 Tax=Capsicum annuum TaxID=4072 RepID=A0A2G2ZQW8_CAPAN|nr:hypothetical protein T459_12811 [Capsicum annuum]